MYVPTHKERRKMVDKMSSYLGRKGSDPLTVSTSVVIVTTFPAGELVLLP